MTHYNEVPREYRRNYKAESLEFCAKFALTFVTVFSIAIMEIVLS